MAQQLPPLSSFPPGYVDANNGGRVIAATTVILIVSTTLLGLRLYARTLTTAKRGWDEYLLLPSWLFLIGLITCLYMEVVQAGLGHHTVVILHEDPNKVQLLFKLLYILDWFYVPSNALSRISVCLLYLRVFTNKWARIGAWAVIGFLTANAVAAIIAAQLECTPLEYAWNKNIEGHCFDQMAWYQLTNLPNVVGDVLIMLLPIRTVWELKASTARKMGIATVCLTGSIGLVASCARTATFYTSREVMEDDPMFAEAVHSWTIIECGMYFSAACLIGLRPLLARMPAWLTGRVSTTEPTKVYGTGVSRFTNAKSAYHSADREGFGNARNIPLSSFNDRDMMENAKFDYDEEALSQSYATQPRICPIHGGCPVHGTTTGHRAEAYSVPK